jgi:translation initiation factor 3 subunit B
LDPHCYDQFSVIYEGGEKTAIFLNSHSEPTPVEERQRWTETYVRWSPQGTFLATFHFKGIALWGGENFRQIMKFSHQGVQLIDFSPCKGTW